MTKQEEIREGIAEWYWESIRGQYVPQFKKLKPEQREWCLLKAGEVLKILANQDVAIKVEGELPELFKLQGPHKEFWEKDLKRRLDKAGYVAFEPLIWKRT